MSVLLELMRERKEKNPGHENHTPRLFVEITSKRERELKVHGQNIYRGDPFVLLRENKETPTKQQNKVNR
jgi:hypothetical protein